MFDREIGGRPVVELVALLSVCSIRLVCRICRGRLKILRFLIRRRERHGVVVGGSREVVLLLVVSINPTPEKMKINADKNCLF